MKKFVLFFLFLLVFCGSAQALIVTDNVDKTDFLYEVPYIFATSDIASSQTAVTLPIQIGQTNQVFYYTVPRDGYLVGISSATNAAFTGGAATFDVTINNTVTGVQSVLQVGNERTAVGNSGSGGTTYGYMRQDRAETAAALGFKHKGSTSSYYHNADNPYGRATPLTAGDRIGVKMTTSSGIAPTGDDVVVVVYVLE